MKTEYLRDQIWKHNLPTFHHPGSPPGLEAVLQRTISMILLFINNGCFGGPVCEFGGPSRNAFSLAVWYLLTLLTSVWIHMFLIFWFQEHHLWNPEAGCPGKGGTSGETALFSRGHLWESCQEVVCWRCWAAGPSLKRDLDDASLNTQSDPRTV